MSASLVAWSPWTLALGWTLLHFVWQGALIGAGFAAVRALLPTQRCDARYAAGLGALALIAICPVLTFTAVLHRHAAETAFAGTATTGAPAKLVAAIVPVDGGLPVGIDTYLPWLVLAWVLGVLFMACRALHQWRVLAHVARHCAVPSVELESVLGGLARRFRFVRRIRVLVSEHIDTPTLIGWLKPVILLPTAVALGFPRQQVELILAHELGHLRRYDHLVNLAQALLETLLFYHPVVHWISTEVRNEREICCDALVLRVTSGEPREYARTLAALEELRQPSVQVALAANGGVLLERVRRIVGMPATGLTAVRPNSGLWLLFAAGLVIAVSSVLRIDHHDDAGFAIPGLAIDWLPQTESHALATLALTLPRHRQHFQLTGVASTPAPQAASMKPAPLPGPAAVSLQTRPLDAGTPALQTPADPLPIAVAAVAPATPAPARTESVADIPAPSAEVRATPPVHSAAAPAMLPTATHIVAPEYPAFAHGSTERVEVSFAIGTNGSVRDIAITNADVDDAFKRAAERALRQWRFDPATVSAGGSARYAQTFVFAPGGKRKSEGDEPDCVQSTGSHICRRVDDMLGAPGIRR
jgi:TonB family protein